MQNTPQPWQYQGIQNQEIQPFPTPQRLLEISNVVDVHTARELQSIILEQLCGQPHSAEKTKLLNDALSLLERKWL